VTCLLAHDDSLMLGAGAAVMQSMSCWVQQVQHGVTVPAGCVGLTCSRSSSTLLPVACTLNWWHAWRWWRCRNG
jgi:hypothetical protein